MLTKIRADSPKYLSLAEVAEDREIDSSLHDFSV
jgi:hypothetical protein